jgi:hypothetical protein
MAVFVGLDVHRAQITYDALDSDSGEVRTGRMPAGESRDCPRLPGGASCRALTSSGHEGERWKASGLRQRVVVLPQITTHEEVISPDAEQA